MASTMTRRRAFINHTVQTLLSNGFDGLDIFWMFPGVVHRDHNGTDKINVVRLLEELYTAFKGHKLLLTAAVPIDQHILDEGYDTPAIDRYLDWLKVIGYGLRGYRNGRADIHSPLHPRTFDQADVLQLNLEQGLEALLDRGASKRKLVVGVAFFGRVYRLAFPENTTLHAPIYLFNRPEKGAFLKSNTTYAYFEV
ncbi:hypothetical protein HPB49_008948 [Dermacentor silvarum]|uniref:Uncharacterized protein n=1 Tax=Dermacentor silvarum TaxID=543639 RepID=A0ACB8CE74_DERSI|nr:hypothetical protein HPB49_008948 [Dermacentor silvarum]